MNVNLAKVKSNYKLRNKNVSVGTKKPNYTKRKVVGIGAPVVLGTGAYAFSRLGGGSSSNSESDSSKKNVANEGTGEETGDGTGSGTGSGSGSGSGSGGDGNYKTKVIEVPIDNYEEAMEFATREWNKIKRSNGRTLECEVLGSCKWKVGEWCKVYLPSFDIDGYMYITRVSQSSDGGEWTSNLSLVDYPPGWGKEEIENNDDESDEKSDDSGDGSGESSGESSGNSDGSSGGNGENSGEENTGTAELSGKTWYTG